MLFQASVLLVKSIHTIINNKSLICCFYYRLFVCICRLFMHFAHKRYAAPVVRVSAVVGGERTDDNRRVGDERASAGNRSAGERGAASAAFPEPDILCHIHRKRRRSALSLHKNLPLVSRSEFVSRRATRSAQLAYYLCPLKVVQYAHMRNSLKTLDRRVNSEWASRLAQGRRLVLKVMRKQHCELITVIEPYRASLIIQIGLFN